MIIDLNFIVFYQSIKVYFFVQFDNSQFEQLYRTITPCFYGTLIY